MGVFLEQLRTVLVLLILLQVSLRSGRMLYEAMKEPVDAEEAPLRRRAATREPADGGTDLEDADGQ